MKTEFFTASAVLGWGAARDQSRRDGVNRPDIVPGVKRRTCSYKLTKQYFEGLVDTQPTQFNSNAFTPSPQFGLGNTSRNYTSIVFPPLLMENFDASKSFRIGERVNATVRERLQSNPAGTARQRHQRFDVWTDHQPGFADQQSAGTGYVQGPILTQVRACVLGLLVGFFVLLLVRPAFCSTPAYRQIVCRQYSLDDPAIPAAMLQSLQGPAASGFKDAGGTVWQGTNRGLVEMVAGSNSRKLLTGKDGLPIEALTSVAGDPAGRLWLATSQGAILFVPAAEPQERWFYFASRRYLKDDEVLKIVPVKDGAWVRTRTGISYLGFEPYTLERKSDLFLRRIQQNHNRYGYVSPAELARPGDPDSVRMLPDDNDGLWTSMYVASECFRYADTGSAEALHNARKSLAAILRLSSITGIPGFPARSLMHRGDYREQEGEWHWTPDGQWEWKGDTSSDELVGHFFVYWVAWHLLPDEADRAEIRKVVANIAGGLIDHRWRLIGYGGKVTTWGRYDPEYLNSESADDRALDALELLSHLWVAYQITGEARFLTAYQQVGTRMRYLEMIGQFNNDQPADINYSDEELAFLAFYPLLSFETDAGLQPPYQAALTKLWQLVRTERNPLWNVLYAQGMGSADVDHAATMYTLERIPLDTICWTVKNSQRKDLTFAPGLDRFGLAQATTALPPNERRVIKWNGNPFQLDGGDGGRTEEEGVFFLLPYWLGRYYRLIDAATVTV